MESPSKQGTRAEAVGVIVQAWDTMLSSRESKAPVVSPDDIKPHNTDMGDDQRKLQAQAQAIARRSIDLENRSKVKADAELAAKLKLESQLRRMQREMDAQVKEATILMKLHEQAAKDERKRAEDAETRCAALEKALEEQRTRADDAEARVQQRADDLSVARGESSAPASVSELCAKLAAKESELERLQAHVINLEKERDNMSKIQPPAVDALGPFTKRWIHELQDQVQRANNRADNSERTQMQLQARVEQLTDSLSSLKKSSTTRQQFRGEALSPVRASRVGSILAAVSPERREENEASFRMQFELLMREREAMTNTSSGDYPYVPFQSAE